VTEFARWASLKKATVMHADAIRGWRTRQPFEAFELRLSNEEAYQVRHPEMVAIDKTRIALFHPEIDRFVHIALIQINSIQELQSAQFESACTACSTDLTDDRAD
jgi:hypothetical protein